MSSVDVGWRAPVGPGLIPLFRWFLVCWLVLTTGAAFAIPITLRVEPVGEVSRPVAGVVELSPAGGVKQGEQEPRKVAVEVSGTTTVDLPPGSIWQLSLQVTGFWSAPSIVTVAPETSVNVKAWPVGAVTAKFEVSKNERLPEELAIRFLPAPDRPSATPPPEATVTCPIDPLGRAVCQVPAAALDLRMRARGFVSHYRWGVEVPAGKRVDLGTLTLQRGASLVGWVETAEGRLAPDRCRVELIPTEAGFSPVEEDEARFKSLKVSTRVSDRGFFHFAGVQPGSYTVIAQQPGFAPALLAPVAVMPNAETALQHPLVLAPPLSLEVRLAPPLDLFEKPWKVRVLRMSDIPGRGDEVADRLASPSGVFVERELAPATYLIFVEDSASAQLAFREVALAPESSVVEIELGLVQVEGSVSLAEEPLAADLWFHGVSGGERVKMSSGEDGEFFSYLPHEGKWLVQVQSDKPPIDRKLRDVEVRKRRGKKVAEVELTLPETELAGEVVDESGQPVASALVKLYDPDQSVAAQRQSDDEGSFHFYGVAEGTSTVVATHHLAGESEEVAVEVAERQPGPPVRLVLRQSREVAGQVVSPSGPVPGAAVWALPYGNGAPRLRQSKAMTDVTGSFRLRVPGSSTHLQLTVFPPGYTLTLLPVMPVPEEPMTIDVSPLGGSITLELEEPVDWFDAASPRPALTVDGAELSYWTLHYWSGVNGQDTWRSTIITLPAMPPGRYTGCLASLRAASTNGAGNGCDEGFLSPSSDLVLKLGSAPSP